MRVKHMTNLLSDYHATLNKALKQLTQDTTDLQSDILNPDSLWEMYVNITFNSYHSL